MNGPNEKGGAATPPFDCQCGAITLYLGNPTPNAARYFDIDGKHSAFKGQLPAMLHALNAAGGDGIANAQCRLFSVNPCDQVSALRKRGVRIDTAKGQPTRWILRSQVQEVLP